MRVNQIKLGTVFSGIGAAEEAFKQLTLPYEVVFACDNGERYLKASYEEIMAETKRLTLEDREKYVNGLYEAMGKENLVKKSYFANHEIIEDRWHEDIRFLDGRKYKGKIDLLVGGSPCQSFSTYGKKRGLEDTRGTLFYDYARIIKETQPKVFIFENVRGLLTHDSGKAWEVVKDVFNKLNYEIGGTHILDAQHYGLPQMRKRLFVVGIRKDLRTGPFVLPERKPLECSAKMFLDINVEDKYYLAEKGFKWVTDVSRNLNKARVNRDIIGCQTAYQQLNWIGDFKVESPKSHHYDHPRIYVGKYKNQDAVARMFTPEECLRLMGFKDFKIQVNDKAMYRQAGNSIAVPVLIAIIEKLINFLDLTNVGGKR